MAYDDRSVKGMSSSFMRARIGTKILASLYETAPSLLTSAIRLMVELPGSSGASPPIRAGVSGRISCLGRTGSPVRQSSPVSSAPALYFGPGAEGLSLHASLPHLEGSLRPILMLRPEI